MSARVLTAYLVSISLVAGIISQALAKPPDLPAKVQISCEKESARLVLKTYQVADLVIPVESAPWPDLVCPAPMPEEAKRAPEPVLPEPAPMLASPPFEVMPQPFGFVTMPVPAPAPYYPVPIPAMRTPVFGLAKSSPTQDPKACCPACASAHCNSCGSDSPCKAPYCAAAGCAATPAHAAPKTQEDQLIQLIINTIKPESWEVNGGHGTIDYFPLGMALTINQTPFIHEEVMGLLEGLRRLQNEQIAVEVRVISVPKGFGEDIVHKFTQCCGHCASSCSDVPQSVRKSHGGSLSIGVGVKCDAGVIGGISAKASCAATECCSKDGPCPNEACKLTFLTDDQVEKYMTQIQANPKTNLMMAPKLTTFNGQTANINVMEQQHMVLSMKTIRQGDHDIYVPQSTPFSTGMSFSVKPTYSADHRFISMEFEAEEKSLNAPLNCDNGSPVNPGALQAIPVAVIVQRIHQAVCVPCGQTALFKTWSRCDKVPEECGLPILSCLPYIGDMFKTVSYHPESADVWIMITPRIVNSQEVECRPPAAAASYTVTDNLEKLQQAQALLEQAEHCRRMGQAESARHIYEKVRQLCPGSRYAQMAARRLMRLPAQDGDQSMEVLTIKDGHVIKTRILLSGHDHPAEKLASAPSPMLVADYMKLRNTPEFKRAQEVSDYLDQYWQACAEGRMSEATQWAVQALALDPACFSKVRDAGWKKSPQPAVMPSAN